MENINIKNRVLCDIALEGSERDVNKIYNYFQRNYNLNDLEFDKLKKYISTSFMPVLKQKFKRAFSNKNQFEVQHQKWLDSAFCINTLKRGRKSIGYNKSSRSSKWRKISDIRKIYSQAEIQQAFLTSLRTNGNSQLANKINILLSSDTEEIFEEMPVENDEEQDKVLSLIEDIKLTKHQYETLRSYAISRNAYIFPSYKKLSKAKELCYPLQSGLKIEEKGAEVDLQHLLDHTINRIIKIPNVTLPQIPQNEKGSLRFLAKWGCDGASGYSKYNQSFSDKALSDESIFMISMVPLKLEIKTSFGWEVVWKNERPSSTKFCRPIKFEYVSETPEKIKNDVNDINNKIKKLIPTTLNINSGTYEVVHELFLTMIDGKVCQALTLTSSPSNCVICGAKPSEMNNLSAKRKEKIENFQYGISTLHAWIRFMECILHLAYHLPFRKWSARNYEDKEIMKKTKIRIQEQFRKKMSLYVDVPKQGTGTSNNGNTARRFFRDPQITSSITGIDENLIRRFGIILQTLACGKKIDADKFDKYASETAKLYVDLYSWYYMPASVHKILIHGKNIIESFLFPIGDLSEEAQEARNKDFKHIREFNTRKHNRFATNEDIVHKLLISSDPYISSLRSEWKHFPTPIDAEAQNLLVQE